MGYDHMAGVIWTTGLAGAGKTTFAHKLASRLKKSGRLNVINLDGDKLREEVFFGTNLTANYERDTRLSLANHYVGLANYLASQGQIVIVSTISMFDEIYERNREIFPNYIEIFLNIDKVTLFERNQKNLYISDIKTSHVYGVDIKADYPKAPHFLIENHTENDINAVIEDVIHRVEQQFLSLK